MRHARIKKFKSKGDKQDPADREDARPSDGFVSMELLLRPDKP